MNYLAHFHLAGDSDELLLGALLGDYVKGPLHLAKLQRYFDSDIQSARVVAGIQLHRKIDSFFDQELLPQLAINMEAHRSRRYLPIALDLFFDYALSNNWDQLETIPLNHFHQKVITAVKPFQDQLPPPAGEFFQRLDQHTLLLRYGNEPFLRRVAQHIASRLPPNNHLMATFNEVMDKQDAFLAFFSDCYPQLHQFAKLQRESLLENTSKTQQ